MAVLGILKLDNKEYRLITFDLKSTQAVDKTGKPSQRPSGLQIDLTIESDSSTDLLQWMLGNEPKDGIITFYKADGMSKFNELKFKKAHCINLTEKFEANGILPMRQIITISEPRREEVKEVIAPPKRVIQTEEEEKTEDKTNANGHFYNNEGVYWGKIGSGDNVYITDKLSFSELEKGKNVEKEKIVFFTEKHRFNNEQLLNRAHWVYGEGGGFFTDYYAFAIKNLKQHGVWGPANKSYLSDEAMYKTKMTHKNKKTNKILNMYPGYFNGTDGNVNSKAFCKARKNLLEINALIRATSAIKSVIGSIDGTLADPTNGCYQWVGGQGKEGNLSKNPDANNAKDVVNKTNKIDNLDFYHTFYKIKKE
jgi:hypothetical protein